MMKRRYLTLAIVVVAFLYGCGKIEVRVHNTFRADLPDFSIGSIQYDTVKTGVSTGYKEIERGTHTILIAGKHTGEITIDNTVFSPSSQWTLTVSNNDSGSYVLSED
jgi:hypothetical protein